MLAILLSSCFVLAPAAGSDLQDFCDGRIRIEAPETIRFKSEELFFLCGNDQQEAWSEIPLEQARIHLEAFLQARGFHAPEFDLREDRIFVQTGKVTRVEGLQLHGDEGLSLRKLRRPIGRPLNPENLDFVESWMKRELGFESYPCAEVSTKGETETGQIHVFLLPNRKRQVERIDSEELGNLAPEVLQRYYAIDEGETYSAIATELSSRRIESEGVVQDHRWNLRCVEPDGVILEESVLVGEPRLFRIAVGADTEEYLVGQIGWKSVRLGKRASSLDLEARASFKRQRASALSKWYVFSELDRPYLRSQLRIERKSESRFHTLDTDLDFRGVWKKDFVGSSLEVELGPSISDSRNLGVSLPPPAQFLSLDFGARWMSHPFEYFLSNPQSGYSFGLNTKYVDSRFLSPFQVAVIGLDAQYLFELFRSDPRILIVGLRGDWSNVWSSLEGEDRESLPTRFRRYLGGIESVRGFDRLELPREDRVMLSSLSGGIELRSDYPIHPSLQPFVFLDAGLLGEKSFRLDEPVYWSPGGGLRWQSPIGSVRAMLAHGFVSGDRMESEERSSHWQWFLSFGREF